jgi:hypothetical protein
MPATCGSPARTFKDWRLPQWEPGHFTLLFFHDEAVSFAAGHRPCALCRRNAYNAYRQAVATVHATAPRLARDLDRRLHAERMHRGTHRRRLHRLPWAELPDGAFVALDDGPAIVLGGSIVAWTTSGYGVPRRRPTRGDAEVITPPTSVAALRGGYPLQVDETAFPG